MKPELIAAVFHETEQGPECGDEIELRIPPSGRFDGPQLAWLSILFKGSAGRHVVRVFSAVPPWEDFAIAIHASAAGPGFEWAARCPIKIGMPTEPASVVFSIELDGELIATRRLRVVRSEEWLH